MSEKVVVQELLTVDGTVFALRKMHIGMGGMPYEGEIAQDFMEEPEMEDMEYEDSEESDEMEQFDPDDVLNPRQKCQYEAFEWIAEKFGKWDKGAEANGAHYMEAEDNPFQKEGMICANCVFFQGGRGCEIVSGDIDPNALCKLWIIASENLVVRKAKSVKEGDFVEWDNVGGEARGRVTHVMREGTLGVPESSFKIKAQPDDPAVLIQLYRKNSEGKFVEQKQFVGHKMSELRQIANLEKEDRDQNKPPQGAIAAGKRAQEWIREGLHGKGFTNVGRARAAQLANGENVSEETVRRMAAYFTRHEKDQQAEGFSAGEKNYPRPGRVAWDAWGGDAGKSWAQGLVERWDRQDMKKEAEEKRFTLGPWYVPNSLDAHAEWTDPEELQKALWDYVKSGNRQIRLQHVPETVAGHWVEAMTMPFETDVPMMNLEQGTVEKRKFPEGTVFLGVQWEPWAWELVKQGAIRGFSIGGKAARKEEDLYAVLDKSSGGETVAKGDKPGHAFRGNQWTRGGGGGVGESRPASSSRIQASKEATGEAKLQAESALDEIGSAANATVQDLGSQDLSTAKRAVQQDLVQARSMTQSAFGIQQDRLNGTNGRSMSSASDRVAKNDYANRMDTYASSMSETAGNLLRNGVFPRSKAFEVEKFVESVQNAAAQLSDAARTLRGQP